MELISVAIRMEENLNGTRDLLDGGGAQAI